MILVTGGKKFVAILFLVFLGTVFVFKVLKSKNARKQTGFKIQFYIGIHLTGVKNMTLIMSPCPTDQHTYLNFLPDLPTYLTYLPDLPN